jgi:hypothetical protein
MASSGSEIIAAMIEAKRRELQAPVVMTRGSRLISAPAAKFESNPDRLVQQLRHALLLGRPAAVRANALSGGAADDLDIDIEHPDGIPGDIVGVALRLTMLATQNAVINAFTAKFKATTIHGDAFEYEARFTEGIPDSRTATKEVVVTVIPYVMHNGSPWFVPIVLRPDRVEAASGFPGFEATDISLEMPDAQPDGVSASLEFVTRGHQEASAIITAR